MAGAVFLAALLRLPLNPLLGPRVAFITFFPAIIYSAWIMGWGGGLLATALSAALVAFLILPPTLTHLVTSPADQLSLVIFVIVGGAISALGQAQRSARRQAEESADVLRESEARKSAILNIALDAIIVIDEQGSITEFNPAAERTFGYARAEALGRPVAETIIPPSLREKHWQGLAHYRATGEGPILGQRIEVTAMRKDGSEFPVELTIVPSAGVDGQDGQEFTAYLRDISERREQERALHESEERQRLALQGAQVGTWHWDIPNNTWTWSNTMRALLGRPGQESLTYDDFLAAVHPEDRERTHAAVIGALENRTPYDVEFRVVWPDGSVHWQVARGRSGYDAQGAPLRMEGVAVDITDRKQTEQDMHARAEREALLNEIGQAIRTTLDPDEIQQAAVRALGEGLRADRCYFSLYDLAADLTWIGRDFRRDDLPSLAGHYRISQFQVDPADYYPNGRPLVINDVTTLTFPGPMVTALQALRVRSAIAVPFFDGGHLVATLTVAMADEPHDWTPNEIALVEAVAAQTRTAVEAARLLAEQQARVQREALLSRIGLAIRSSLDPTVIQETAAAVLGEALGADRCYFVTYDPGRDSLQVGADWRRPDLPSLAGTYRFSDFQPFLDELFGAGTTAVREDARSDALSAQARAIMEEAGLRALIAVPLFDGGRLAAALIAAMTDEPRAWTPDEVDLVEAAAEQTRTALATAHITQREHAIATQLQAALQPAPPGAVPGLALAEHYLPALDEAEIGGDFYDVFSTDKGVTYLAVGDLSGKGLAAAAQVATVRNMLRFALYQASYSGHSVAGPLTSLNRTLADHGLLMGFATLFVGRYDGAAGTFTYANAGQEPGLLWRAASGQVEELAATGPVLGMAGGGEFDERTVTLTHGDVLAVFTDGLTEAGPNRRELLGVAGVAALLQKIAGARPTDQPALETARAVVTRLIADVDAYALGGVRDDVCLLVGVIENSRGAQGGVSGNAGPDHADRSVVDV